MKKKFQYSLFIFRRDLRIYDNTALEYATKQSENVYTCFIFDPKQISNQNEYKSNNAVQCMIESLKDLQTDIEQNNGELLYLHGAPEKVLGNLLKKIPFQAIFCNKDYTPFSKKRDQKILAWCKKNGIEFCSYHDLLLHAPGIITTTTQQPYKVFTPYYKKASTQKIISPKKKIPQPLSKGSKSIANFSLQQIHKLFTPNKHIAVHGGRKNSANILHNIANWKDYEQTRNFPEIATTHLSAYIKFGTHSLREIYHTMVKKLGTKHPLIRQLYWHDFYTQISANFPHVFGHAFYKKYDKLTWSYSKKNFDLWCSGTTGFPIVDAGMRQLNQTGFMHNRVRMITASFLIKDLHISWQWGEKYFAQRLVDYDPAVNNGNWQWVASTGCDRQPYFRIFNPWRQQKRFDPECAYIKKWIPELSSLSSKEIHNWKHYNNTKNVFIDYPAPILDHTDQAKIAIERYKTVA